MPSSGEFPSAGTPLGERIARVETVQRMSDKQRQRDHAEVMQGLKEATDASREASAQTASLSRSVSELTTTVGKIDDRLRSVETTGRHPAAPQFASRESSQPIDLDTEVMAEDVLRESIATVRRRTAVRYGVGAGGAVGFLVALVEIIRIFFLSSGKGG
ncbi:MAG: hypothetical protein K0U16_07505 [Gammaproteobacteria bacterium]|nr:hypothetical protein [Gammaproteobacteria bacterium]